MTPITPGPALATDGLTRSIEAMRAAVHSGGTARGWRALARNRAEAAFALAVTALLDALLSLIAAMRAEPSKNAVSDPGPARDEMDAGDGEGACGMTSGARAVDGRGRRASARRRPGHEERPYDAAVDTRPMGVQPVDAGPARGAIAGTAWTGGMAAVRACRGPGARAKVAWRRRADSPPLARS